MNKIPLEDTITAAFRFLFTRILSVIGTLWLPMLLLVAVWGGVIYLVVPHEWWMGQFPVLDEKHPDLGVILSIVRPFLIGAPLIGLVSLYLYSMMKVGLLRLSLGRAKGTYVFLSFGADVWRVMAASLLCMLTVMAAYVVILVFGFGGGALIETLKLSGWWMALLVLLVIAAVCFAIYATVRLYFFLPAVVVAEHRIGFAHSWRLGRGNFWRIVLISLLIVFAVSIVGGMISNIIMAPIMTGNLMQMQDKPTPAEIAAFLRSLVSLIPVFVGMTVIQQVAMMALMAGAQGSAYNALNAKQEEASVS